MFDIGAPELLVIIIVAVLVIGPKDMPLALRTVGKWIGNLRRISGQFRSGFDTMVREAELDEMEKKWKAQNEAIMAKSPSDDDNIPRAAAESGISDMSGPDMNGPPADYDPTLDAEDSITGPDDPSDMRTPPKGEG